jgi:hypothetical protein
VKSATAFPPLFKHVYGYIMQVSLFSPTTIDACGYGYWISFLFSTNKTPHEPLIYKAKIKQGYDLIYNCIMRIFNAMYSY